MTGGHIHIDMSRFCEVLNASKSSKETTTATQYLGNISSLWKVWIAI